MENNGKIKLIGFVGRFTLVNLITYALIGAIFLSLQSALPTPSRIALDFYRIYRSLDLTVVVSELVRGGIMALMLYPFYKIIVGNKRGILSLLIAMWGLALLGSLEPFPGSIEGMIYTETTFIEHLLVLSATAMQVLIFSFVFLRWENSVQSKINRFETGGQINE